MQMNDSVRPYSTVREYACMYEYIYVCMFVCLYSVSWLFGLEDH
jgi:hypothetical protein